MAVPTKSFDGLGGTALPDDVSLWLQMALDRTGSQLWTVDIPARTMHVLSSEAGFEEQRTYERFPDSFLEGGRVHPSSQESFRRFCEGILSGKRAGTENFTLRYRETSCYGWAQLSYRTVFDEDGRPARAVGIRTNLSYRASGDADFLRRRPDANVLYPSLVGDIQANLTTGFVERLQIESSDMFAGAGSYGLAEALRLCEGRLYSKEDVTAFRQVFDRDRLLALFTAGRRWASARLRLISDDGSIAWVLAAANLTRDSKTGDVLLYGYLCGMEGRRKQEAELEESVFIDEVTGVYDAATLRSMSRRLMEKRADRPCALVLVKVEGPLEAGGRRRDGAADEAGAFSRDGALTAPVHGDVRLEGLEEGVVYRLDLATAFSVAFGADCPIGRVIPGAVVSFLPDAGSQKDLQRRAERAVSFVRMSLQDVRGMSTLRFVTCIVRAERAGDADYDAMVDQAVGVCSLYGGESEDIVVFPDAQEEGRRAGAGLGADDDDCVVPVPLQKGRSLTSGEKDVAVECLSAMLEASSLEESMKSFLRCVGRHYHADRAYLTTFSEGQRTFTVPYEWCAEGKYGIAAVVSGKRVEQFPLLERSVKSRRPQLLARLHALEGGIDGVSASTPSWRFAVYPVGDDGGVRWTLNVENPRSIPTDTALLDALVPLVRKERGRFLRSERTEGSNAAMDRLLSLPSFHNFTDTVFSLNSDLYSSMGALTLDIPSLSDITEDDGFEHGMRLILRASEVLSDLFGSDTLFHVRDSEFVVLSANTIYEVFIDRCTRARQLLQASYPGAFRLGYTWAEGAFSASTLVREAQVIMRCDESASTGYRVEDDATPGFSSAASQGRLDDGGRFLVYLQPKVDVRTGMAVGAEMLARAIDASGRSLPTAAIVSEMEREGTIRDLDYFVFDRLLATLDDWMRRGVKLIPVSSNFSRSTLLSPSSFASVLAVMSRYPEVPRKFVQMEITESACNVERATLADIVERFQSLGVRMELDDFGSDYSNLSVLANIPFDAVKLDRSLVDNLASNDAAKMIVRNVVQVCKSRHALCIAEGIETKEQVLALIEQGCHYVQGYYYSKPIPLDEFERRYLHGLTGLSE